ncbi:MAG: dihydroorotase [Cyanophyceae cyanobacterium]
MNHSSVVLQQVRVVEPASGIDKVADISIADGKIQLIADNLNFTSEEASLDCRGLILGPGLVDLYSRSGELGFEHRETFSSLSAAAAAGGFTRIAVMPNPVFSGDQSVAIPSLKQLATIRAANDKSYLSSLTDIQFWGALTNQQQQTELASLAEQVLGFVHAEPIEDFNLLLQSLKYLNQLKKPVGLVAASPRLKRDGVVREGVDSLRYGFSGDPALSESAAIAALLEVIAVADTPAHLMRISTRRSVELIADAKARGVPVTASTSWMHLLLDTRATGSYDPNLRLDPPLGTGSDREALIEGVRQGIIDAIAVDHTPYTYEEKTVAFAEAPAGAIGLELALPLLWQQFVTSGEWTATQLWQALSVGPQRCLHQEPISCALGHKAELTLFDPQTSWTVEAHNLQSLCANTPWLGKQIVGRVVRVWNGSEVDSNSHHYS